MKSSENISDSLKGGDVVAKPNFQHLKRQKELEKKKKKEEKLQRKQEKVTEAPEENPDESIHNG